MIARWRRLVPPAAWDNFEPESDGSNSWIASAIPTIRAGGEASLTLVKRIVNDNGGTKVVGDFGITTDAGPLVWGEGVADGPNALKYTSNTLPVRPGPYSLHEDDVTVYTEGSWTCIGQSWLVNGDIEVETAPTLDLFGENFFS